MPALLELQERFIRGLLGETSDILTRTRTGGAITPEQRLQIYRNNTFFILTDNLLATFPATAALGSEAFFRYAARAFIKAGPPHSGDMNVYGAHFPSFLREAGLVTGHPFLADVAELEWLRQESYMAADANSGRFDPSMRLLSSPWPVIQLWKLGKGQLAVGDVEMGAGENVVILRRDDGVEMWGVEREVFSSIRSIAQQTCEGPRN